MTSRFVGLSGLGKHRANLQGGVGRGEGACWVCEMEGSATNMGKIPHKSHEISKYFGQYFANTKWFDNCGGDPSVR